MKRMINCPNEILVDLCGDENWYEIIKLRNHVRIPGKNPLRRNNYVKDQPDNEWEVMDRDGINIHELSSFVTEAETTPVKALQHPSDIYIYSTVSGESRDCGVYMGSARKRSTRSLERTWRFDTIREEEYSWKEFFERLTVGPVPPSNALVIIDRYFFSYISEFNLGYQNGIRNLYDILDALLPKSFNGEYQVLVVFDESRIDMSVNLDTIVNAVEYIRKMLDRNYEVTIELLALSRSTGERVYAQTHDRWILSNYFSVLASHGFSAFIPDDGHEQELICKTRQYATWNQTLQFESAYAGLSNIDQDNTSLPFRHNEETLSALRRFIRRTDNRGFYYACNGEYSKTLDNLRNRLLTKD